MYKRKTRDEYNLMGLYSYGYEILTTESTLKEIKQRLKEYNLNEPTTTYKITKNRIKI